MYCAMKALLVSLALIFMVSGAVAQEIPVYNSFEDYSHLLEKDNDTTYVVNYWATYCAPCVKEMPVFRKMEKEYAGQPVEIILTSMDFGGSVLERVRSFMDRHRIRSRVVVLDDPDTNSWIDKVSPQWSGALPATIVYRGDSRDFHAGTITYSELKDIIESKMNQP